MSDRKHHKSADVTQLLFVLALLGILGNDKDCNNRFGGDILSLLLILSLCGFGGLSLDRHC